MLALMQTELKSFARDVASRGAAESFSQAIEGDEPLPDLIDRLAEIAGETPSELRHAFGRRVFESFATLYPDFIPSGGGVIAFLENLERHVHVEMRAIYPDAEPPHLLCERVSPTEVRLHYRSRQPIAEMCAGMLGAALAHFDETGAVERRPDDCCAEGEAVFHVSLDETRARAAA